MKKKTAYNLLIVFLIVVYLATAGVTMYVQLKPSYVVPNIYFEPVDSPIELPEA